MHFKKKPVVIEAVQIDDDGSTVQPTPQWLIDAMFARTVRPVLSDRGNWLEVDTLEGTMRGNPGDWIIQGVAGELYPCKPDIFEATYEHVADELVRE